MNGVRGIVADDRGLTRWPDLRALASARRSSVTAVVAAPTRSVSGVAERDRRDPCGRCGMGRGPGVGLRGATCR